MSITWAGNVAVAAPELASAPAPLQTMILAIVDRQVDDGAWGDMADDGRTYLAAHFGSLSVPGVQGSAGALTSETLGQMSRSYGLPPGVEGELATTKYGVMYMHLLRVAVGPGAFVP